MENDAIHAFLETFESGAGASSHIPVQHPAIACCCGNATCAYLLHNQNALDGLERSVHTAAGLGKALLMRHEAYIADSERERKAMTSHVEELETEKQTLEEKNATAIEENRNLLDQLENLNNAVTESDTQVTNLQATLRSMQQELHSLSASAARAQRLEQQLAEFEREQAAWQSTMQEKQSSEKSAIRRWQQAERTLAGIQEEMERIERESREEKERHVELINRMERRHVVQRELDSAAGRLKGAAALRSSADDGGPTVVSHFVKDILQDNANLQMGIVELRDMLHTSNEEVETLRNQLSTHQPLAEEANSSQPLSPLVRPHLKEEMRRATASELHVHHHYHAPPTAQKVSVTGRSRSRKKRYGSLTLSGANSSGSYTPHHSLSSSTPSTAATILSQTAASLPEGVNKRLSVHSAQTYHSLRDASGASSPMSTQWEPSIYDRVFSDAGHESSRPTTPDTEDLGSPFLGPVQSRRSSKGSYYPNHASGSSHKNRSSLDSIMDMSCESLRHLEQQNAEAVIPEEDEQEDWENTSSILPEHDCSTNPPSEEFDLQAHRPPRPTLRRASSHESILSFSGMDIHTLKSRPSQLLTPFGARSFTSQAVISGATAHASRPGALSHSSNSCQSILSGIAPTNRQPSGQSMVSRQGIGSKVGGWVFGRWGASPTPTASTLNAEMPTATPKPGRAVSVNSSNTTRSEDSPTPKKVPVYRSPGINQTGPIFGFAPETKLDHPPIMSRFDADAMKKVLDDAE